MQWMQITLLCTLLTQQGQVLRGDIHSRVREAVLRLSHLGVPLGENSFKIWLGFHRSAVAGATLGGPENRMLAGLSLSSPVLAPPSLKGITEEWTVDSGSLRVAVDECSFCCCNTALDRFTDTVVCTHGSMWGKKIELFLRLNTVALLSANRKHSDYD